jgi:hypothetical protein
MGSVGYDTWKTPEVRQPYTGCNRYDSEEGYEGPKIVIWKNEAKKTRDERVIVDGERWLG